MKIKNLVSTLFILLFLQSCAQNNEVKKPLKIKSIYEVIIDDINWNSEKYGLKGNIKTVEQKTIYAANDSITDFSAYETFDLNDEPDYFNLAEMDNDCKVTFNAKGKLASRISYGRRFDSTSVQSDTIIYDANKRLVIMRSNLEGDDFAFPGDAIFEYDKFGHLVKHSYHNQVWTYTYFEKTHQVRISHREGNEFRYDNLYTYDKFGQQVESQSYNEDGSKDVKITREYDNKGFVEKETLYSTDGTQTDYPKHIFDNSIKLYKKFDHNKNCTVRIIVDPKGKATVRSRKFEYYN